MILIYEPFSIDYEHVPVNYKFLNIICKRFPQDEIVFFGEKEHLMHIKRKNIYKNVAYNPIKVVRPHEGKLHSLLNEKRNIKYLAKKYDKEIKFIFVMNSHPHTMYYVKKYFSLSRKIFIVHGNIEELRKQKKIYQLGYYVKLGFKYKNDTKKVRYIVLGDSIRKNVLKYMPYIQRNLISVPHPYQFENLDYKYSEKNVLRIGTIGSMSKEKRSEMIFELEKELLKNKVNNISLVQIGELYHLDIPDKTSVELIGYTDRKLDDETYNKEIKKLDYILFFFPKDSYQMTASGALCDAIAHNKPVIAIKNDYFSWVFQEVGEFGYLCDDLDAMVSIIKSLVEGKEREKMKKFKNIFRNAHQFFSEKHVYDIFEKENIWMI